MKILVCELITGGGLYREPMLDQLLHEGSLMRDAVLADLAALPDVHIVCPLDDRLDTPAHAHQVIRIPAQQAPMPVWQELIQEADAVLLIAPEIRGVLLQLTQAVEQAGKPLLGCHSHAVALFSDKWASDQWMRQQGIPTLTSYQAAQWLKQMQDMSSADANATWVLKPRDGAGAEGLMIAQGAQLKAHLQQVASQDASELGNGLVQPYCAGISASFCMLAHRQQAYVLSANQQILQRHGQQLQLTACHLNAMQAHLPAFEQIAQQIAQAMPDLQAYLGVDVQILAEPDGVQFAVLDINPRLTTSYVGLHRAMQINPARCLLDLMQPRFVMPAFRYQPVSVFTQAEPAA